MILVLLRILTTVGLVTIYSIRAILDPKKDNHATIVNEMKEEQNATRIITGPAQEAEIANTEVAVIVRGTVMIEEGVVKNLK